MTSCSVRCADWNNQSDQQALRDIRYEVFVTEQNVPESLEWSDDQGNCVHAIAFDENGQAIGTARLDPDAHIGRMAVKSSQRGLGVGRALLRFLVEQAKSRGEKEVQLSAQTHAIEFYRQEGFEAFGPEFMDAGIPHRSMLKNLV